MSADIFLRGASTDPRTHHRVDVAASLATTCDLISYLQEKNTFVEIRVLAVGAWRQRGSEGLQEPNMADRWAGLGH